MGHLGGLKRVSLCMLEKINKGKEGKDSDLGIAGVRRMGSWERVCRSTSRSMNLA